MTRQQTTLRTTRTERRRSVDRLLEVQYQPDDPVRPKLRASLEEAYSDATDEEWDDVTARFLKAFSLEIETSERPTFDSLVTEGVFARYLEWTAEHEAPTQYHFGALITAVAAGLGRRPLIEWEARETYPNLYTLLVGPSGARKGSAMNRAVRMAQAALGTYRLPNEGTPQGYAAALRRREKDTGGIADGLIVSDEFSVLISKDRNKEDLVKWLTDWFDSPDHWDRALRGEEVYELHDVYLSVVGASNLEWLKTLPNDAVLGGFMPRHILLDAPGKRHWCSRPKFNAALGEEITQHLARVASSIPDVIRWDTTSGRYLDSWYETDVRAQFEASKDEKFKKWLERKQAAAMKLAVVWQLADGGPKDVVAVEWLERARRVVDWGDTTVAHVYGALGVTPEGQIVEDIMAVVHEHNGSISRRDLMRGLGRTYSWSRVQGALNTLRLSGELRVDRGPRGVVWSEV